MRWVGESLRGGRARQGKGVGETETEGASGLVRAGSAEEAEEGGRRGGVKGGERERARAVPDSEWRLGVGKRPLNRQWP